MTCPNCERLKAELEDERQLNKALLFRSDNDLKLWIANFKAARDVAKHWMYLYRDTTRSRMKDDYSDEVDKEIEARLKANAEGGSNV